MKKQQKQNSPVVSLTKEQYQEMCERILELGKNRKEQGALNDEADFLCGAMSVMEALGITLPVWALFIMTGRSLLED